MRLQPRFWAAIALSAALAACAVKVPSTGAKTSTTPTAKAASSIAPLAAGSTAPGDPASRNVAQLVGTVRGGAGLISNNGSGILANNGSTVLSDHAGAFRLSAIDEPPLAGAEVFLADASGAPIPNLATATTDAKGHFTFAQAPSGFTFQVRVRVKTAGQKDAALATLVKTSLAGNTVDVSLASSYVTTSVLQGSGSSLGTFNPATFQAAIDATENELKPDELPDLSDRAAVLDYMSRLEARVIALQNAVTELQRDVADIKDSLNRIEQRLDASPSPTPVPTPTPTPTPVPLNVETIAGVPQSGYVDGPAAQARFYKPVGVVVDALGGVYVSELFNQTIRHITAAGQVSTYGGTVGAGGHADGPAAQSAFAAPAGMALDPDGTLYIAEYGGNDVRRISTGGQVSTLAGSGVPGAADGPVSTATFTGPTGLVRDPDGNFYVSEYDGHRIRKITPGGQVSTLAGDGTTGSSDGVGAAAHFNHPYGLAWDPLAHNLIVADTVNNRIRRVALDGTVTTIAGDGTGAFADGQGVAAKLWSPIGVAVDAKGTIYVGDNKNARIRRIAPDGKVDTLAGTGVAGYADGAPDQAQLGAPYLMSLDPKGYLVFADYPNQCVRRLRLK